MKIAVMGAGAVGCFYGALLAKAGHEVVLIGRPALAEAVAARGLLLDPLEGPTETIPLGAATGPEGVAGAQVVLFCVKSGDTESAGAAIAPHLAADAVILSLQNGVGNPERLAPIVGRPVVPVAVYVATRMIAPGHVRHEGRNELILGTGPGAELAAEALRGAGVTVEVSDGVTVAQWTKLVVNCAFNPLSAVSQLPYGPMYAEPGIPELMAEVVAEARAVARASGVEVPEAVMDTVRAIPGTMPGQHSSTAQDIARGRPTEIDHLNGEIVRRGAALGIPTPVNRTLLLLTRLAERARAQ